MLFHFLFQFELQYSHLRPQFTIIILHLKRHLVCASARVLGAGRLLDHVEGCHLQFTNVSRIKTTHHVELTVGLLCLVFASGLQQVQRLTRFLSHMLVI
jgi:hypothetical protein